MEPEVIEPKKPAGFSLFQPQMIKAEIFLLIAEEQFPLLM